MEWVLIGTMAAALAAFLVLKKAGGLSDEAARDCLARGAVVIDVREPDEFQARHIPGAINIPLSRLKSEIGQQVPDKNQVVLLHCLSGGRSGLGRRTLLNLGYQHVYNLGSYQRAERIVRQSQK